MSRYFTSIMKTLIFILIFLTTFFSFTSSAQDAFVFKNANQNYLIGKKTEVLVDENSKMTLKEVMKSNLFKPSLHDVPNLGIGKYNFWLKFKIRNESTENHLLLDIPYPILNQIDFYEIEANNQIKHYQLGDIFTFDKRKYKQTNFIFDLQIPPQTEKQFYIKIESGEQIIVPIFVGTERNILQSANQTEMVFGLYLGLIMAMALYNLFLYFMVRDTGYIYYVIYIIFIGLTQASLHGYLFKYFWPDSPEFSNHTLIIFSALTAFSAIQFTRDFLQTKHFTPKLDKGLLVFIFSYIIAVIANYSGYAQLSFKIADINALLLSLYCFVYATIIVRKGFKPAKYFIIAWSFFLTCMIVYVFRNLGILPYNNFTNYSLLAGTSFETIVLSIAFAAKFNELKKEKEISQIKMVEVLQENERIVKEQNVTLELKVNHRTIELSKSNEELNVALKNLKDAQSQLVEAEKMASLGQLTAGIAHEINNPINFVTSSVVPLKRDIDFILKIIGKYETLHENFVEEKLKDVTDYKKKVDYEYLKEEISIILEGIEEGAGRTAEIIRGLRNFSRLDEGGLKKVDIHSGIDSTLVLLNSSVRDKITIIKDYGNVPQIECFAGKLNQVFMNLLSNAIHAVSVAHQNNGMGKIIITTKEENNHLVIAIKDNGTGMSEDTKNKIFDPFFTTKNANEGTGLGLSIVRTAIESHNAKLTISTALGEGTEFVIYLPINNF